MSKREKNKSPRQGFLFCVFKATKTDDIAYLQKKYWLSSQIVVL